MFFTLFIVTFLIASAVSYGVVQFFDKSINNILMRIVADELAAAWVKYIKFASYVVGISGGVRVYSLEQYVSARYSGSQVVQLSAETWTLEVYRTLISTLQSLAWVLLVVFTVSLIAFVIVRIFELKATSATAKKDK